MLPTAIGPYRLSVALDNLLFVSGQLGLDPQTGQLAQGIEAQVKQALQNLKAILEEQKSGLEKVVKTTLYLVNIADFGTVNTIYGEYFKQNCPARSTLGVKELPKGALFEIDAIASR